MAKEKDYSTMSMKELYEELAALDSSELSTEDFEDLLDKIEEGVSKYEKYENLPKHIAVGNEKKKPSEKSKIRKELDEAIKAYQNDEIKNGEFTPVKETKKAKKVDKTRTENYKKSSKKRREFGKEKPVKGSKKANVEVLEDVDTVKNDVMQKYGFDK